MPPALKVFSTGCLLSLLLFCGLLSASNLRPYLSLLGEQADESLPVVSAHIVSGMVLPLSTAPPPAMVQSVTIPVIAASSNAGSATALPTVVSPGTAVRASSPVSPAASESSGSLPAMLRTPAGNGPFPAIVLLHGCNGPFTGVPDWAYRLNAWGYAVLMPDSLTPRGVRAVCDPAEQAKVTPLDRVGDLAAAVIWLRARIEIDPARIAVLGLSHGGVTAMLATQTAYADMRLRAAVDYYGPCQEPRLHGSVPLLALAGEADDWGDPAAHCRSFGAALGHGQPFEIHTYPGVYHAFDGGPASKTVNTGHFVAYDKAAAEDSFTRTRSFLERWIGRDFAP